MDAAAEDAAVVDARDAAVVDAPDVFDAFDAHDAPMDSPPPIDVGVDAASPCPPGSGGRAYVWDNGAVLYEIDPTTLAVRMIGRVDCGRTDPWTFSVSRAGVAYMIYTNMHIFRVDLTTLACTETPFDPQQLGFFGNGYGISVSRDATAERLFVYGRDAAGFDILGVSDLTTFVLTEVIHTSSIGPYPVDMQADIAGHLDILTMDGSFQQLDATTGVGGPVTRPSGFAIDNGDWAVMTWNDEILFFIGNPSVVQRLDLATNTLTTIGQLAFGVLGASAAACSH
jgi:hypothetical protein